MKKYAFLWHKPLGEDYATGFCEAAQVEVSESEEKTMVAKLRVWIDERRAACKEWDCMCQSSGGLITDFVSPKMIEAGMAKHMVTLKQD